jgi:hypothetical protein
MVTWTILIILFVLVLVVGAFLIAAYATLRYDIAQHEREVRKRVGEVRGHVRSLATISEAEIARLKAVGVRQEAVHVALARALGGEVQEADVELAKLADHGLRTDAALSAFGQRLQNIETQSGDARAAILANMRHLESVGGDADRSKMEIVRIAGVLYEAGRDVDHLMSAIESIAVDFERRFADVQKRAFPAQLQQIATELGAIDGRMREAVQAVAARLDRNDELADPAIEVDEHARIIRTVRARLKKVETAHMSPEAAAAVNAAMARISEAEARVAAIDSIASRLAAVEKQVAGAQEDVQRTIDSLKVSKLQFGDKWSFKDDADWLRLMDAGGKDYYGGFAAGKLWAGAGVSVGATGVEVRGEGPGALISNDNMYGLAHGAGGATHLYAGAPAANLRMSLAAGRDAYDSVLVADRDSNGGKKVTVLGKLSVADRMCVDGACVVGGGGGNGRMHLHTPEKIFLLPKGGAELTADWGADPTFTVRSGGDKTAKVCIDDVCITKTDIVNIRGKVDAALAQRAAAEQRAAQQRAAEQRAAEQRAAEQRAAEQRAAEQRAAEQRAAEQRAAEQRAAEQRAAEQRAAEQRAAQQRAAEQRAAEQRAAEQRAAEQRAAEQRAAQQRAAEQRAAEQSRSAAGKFGARSSRSTSCYGAKDGNCYTCNDVINAYKAKQWGYDRSKFAQCN